MKRTTHLLFILLFSCLFSYGQEEYEYTPFPDSNAIWSEIYRAPVSEGYKEEYRALAIFNEDTIINSIKYHKLFRLYDTLLNRDKAVYLGGIREDSSKRVFYKGDNLYEEYLYMNTNDNGEVLLYDFSLEVGDTLYGGNFALSDEEKLIVTKIDTILYNNSFRRKHHFQFSRQKWIEGIGNIRGLLFISGALPTNGIYNTLICFKQNGEQKYLNPEYEECFPGVLSSKIKAPGENEVLVYPNPSAGHIHFEKLQDFKILTIYDLHGQIIENREIYSKDCLTLDTYRFPPGMYFYKLAGISCRNETGKFLVK